MDFEQLLKACSERGDAAMALDDVNLRAALRSSAALRAVFTKYLAGYHPPIYDEDIANGWLQVDDKLAIDAACSLLHTIYRLFIRKLSADRAGISIEQERHWAALRSKGIVKQRQLETLLLQAADLFDSGQSEESNPYPSLRRYKHQGNPVGSGQSLVDEARWCGSDNLRRWAAVVRSSPLEVVFPVTRAPAFLFRPEDLRAGGHATQENSAMNGACVRVLADWIPQKMFRRGGRGYKILSELCGIAGYPVTRESARSTLLNSKRFPQK